MDVGIDLVEFVGNVSFLIEERLIGFFYFFSLFSFDENSEACTN